MDIDDLRTFIEGLPLTGEEAWLDVLMTEIEREMDEESIVTDVLRTSEMHEMGGNKGQPAAAKEKTLMEFYRQVHQILKVLEYKANKRYYSYLEQESSQRNGSS